MEQRVTWMDELQPPTVLPGLLCTAPPIHIAPFLPHRLPLLGNVLGSIPMNESYILSEKQSPLFCPALVIQSTSSVSALNENLFFVKDSNKFKRHQEQFTMESSRTVYAQGYAEN